MLHSDSGCYMGLHGVTNLVLQGVTRSYIVLQGGTWCYIVLHGVTLCCIVLQGGTW